MKLVQTVILTVLCSASLAVAQTAPSSGATRSVTYAVAPVATSGISGSVFIGEYGEATTAVVIALRGTPAGGNHPAHFHAGNCGSSGDIVVPLSNVNGDTGLSVTLTDTPYDDIVTADYYLNIHQSPEASEIIVACSEVGAGAGPIAGQVPGAAGTQTTLVQTQEFTSPRTASYGLFAVAGSGIGGNVQVTERAEGGSEFVVSLTGITQGERYAAALYEGDCGPDRPEVLELDAVSNVAGDPFVSITDTGLNFEDVANGDYFLYIFNGEKGSALAACGEVGVGANR